MGSSYSFEKGLNYLWATSQAINLCVHIVLYFAPVLALELWIILKNRIKYFSHNLISAGLVLGLFIDENLDWNLGNLTKMREDYNFVPSIEDSLELMSQQLFGYVDNLELEEGNRQGQLLSEVR